jgi:hypothetical protein
VKLFIIAVIAIHIIFGLVPIVVCDAKVVLKDNAKKEVKYEVTISLTYNAISAKDVREKIEQVLKDHKDTCKTEVKIKKGDNIVQAGDGWTSQPYPIIDSGNVLTFD